MIESDPAKLWSCYLQLMRIEEAFRNLTGDLAVRPIFHQLEARIEAHIFVVSSPIASMSRWDDACRRSLPG